MSPEQSLVYSGHWIPHPTLTSIKSKSTAAAHSTSPTMTMADLDLAEPPIRFIEAGEKGGNPSTEVLLLYNQFLELENGFGALPGALKVWLIVLCSCYAMG